LYRGLLINDELKEDMRIIFPHNPHYEDPQLVQLVALQELHDDPCELVNPSSLLWLKVERNFLTLVPLQVGQVTFWSPKTRVSKSLSHFMQ
jgi:hypothetical protein